MNHSKESEVTNIACTGRSGSPSLRGDNLQAGQVFPNGDVLSDVWGIVEQCNWNTGLEGKLRKKMKDFRESLRRVGI